jgi:hypothetical protein
MKTTFRFALCVLFGAVVATQNVDAQQGNQTPAMMRTSSSINTTMASPARVPYEAAGTYTVGDGAGGCDGRGNGAGCDGSGNCGCGNGASRGWLGGRSGGCASIRLGLGRGCGTGAGGCDGGAGGCDGGCGVGGCNGGCDGNGTGLASGCSGFGLGRGFLSRFGGAGGRGGAGGCDGGAGGCGGGCDGGAGGCGAGGCDGGAGGCDGGCNGGGIGSRLGGIGGFWGSGDCACGVYHTFFGGMSAPHNINLTGGLDLDLENGWLVGHGYGRQLSSCWRGEFETSYRNNSTADFERADVSVSGDTAGRLRLRSGMLNVIRDLNFGGGNCNAWRPYAGVGGGVAFIDLEAADPVVGSLDARTSTFAYQLMFGAAKKVRSCVDVYGEYRFYGTNTFCVDTLTPNLVAGTTEANIGQHNFLFGLRVWTR